MVHSTVGNVLSTLTADFLPRFVKTGGVLGARWCTGAAFALVLAASHDARAQGTVVISSETAGTVTSPALSSDTLPSADHLLPFYDQASGRLRSRLLVPPPAASGGDAAADLRISSPEER